QSNIANLILEDGSKLQSLDKEQGEVEAQLAITLAKIQAAQARRGGIGQIVSGGISGGIAGFKSTGNPWGAAGGAVMGGCSAYMTVNAAVTAMVGSGNAQADAARRLAEINAQRD